jgi:hypothetical protein
VSLIQTSTLERGSMLVISPLAEKQAKSEFDPAVYAGQACCSTEVEHEDLVVDELPQVDSLAQAS